MKNILSNKKTAIVLLIVTLISIAFYAYMLIRPISYGMDYHNETAFGGGVFEGTMTFNPDKTMINRNTNFDQEMKSRYYYKNGYVFYTSAQTDEDYEKEVADINENFDDLINTPFYADEINAFRLVASENDGYATVYTCTFAIVFAVVAGVVELALVGLTCLAWIFFMKKTADEEDR